MLAKNHIVYLDHAATTPLDPRVFEAMVPYLKDHFGNASSVHRYGRKARFAIEDARERIAAHLEVHPGEIVFTSGGTESNNMAIKGVGTPGHLVTSTAEHEAVLKQVNGLKKQGWTIDLLEPDASGAVSVDALEAVLSDSVSVVSCMYINNEVGAVNPITELGERVQRKPAVFHCDAVQGLGLYDCRPDKLHVDLMTGSGHKIYGPKGVGFLYVRGGVELGGLIDGGAQERRRRSGTEHVAGIVGMAKAMDLSVEERGERRAHITRLRNRLIEGIKNIVSQYGGLLNTSEVDDRAAPHIVNAAFPPQQEVPLDGEMLILNFDMEGICVSSGSACTSGAIEPSHVLQAMGLDGATASAAVRFSIGKDNTEDEIDYALDKMQAILARMRGSVHA